MKLRALTVTEVNRYIKKTFDCEPILNSLVVEGEISNFSLHTSAHSYFTLKDENSKISCVLFKKDAQHVESKLYNGLKIKATGKISVYERDGKYQLYVKSIQLSGLGDLYLEFEKLKEKLLREGIFDIKFKKEIPLFPKKIAVITSPTGAAVRDIINVIKRRTSHTEILVIPVSVQGENSKFEIERAISLANTLGDVDLIILGRGGGSIEELWSFNEENVARAIFASKIPIISAIGHETDYTIADFVSDLRAPTPSAAAELAVREEKAIQENLNKLYYDLLKTQNRLIEKNKKNLENLAIVKMADKYTSTINRKYEDLDYFYTSMRKTIEYRIIGLKENLSHTGQMLNTVNPLNILEKGYSLPCHENGKLIKTISEVDINDDIVVNLIDGKIKCNVIELVPTKTKI